MKVIVINGFSGSGKDEFVKQFRAISEDVSKFTVNFSSIQPVIDFIYQTDLNVDRKDPKGRTFLSDLGLALESFNDFRTNATMDEIYDACEDSEDYFFVHVREPWIIGKLKAKCMAITDSNIDFYTLLIKRNESIKTIQNKSDSDQIEKGWIYDFTITNNGTLEDLAESARSFRNQIDRKKPEVTV